MDVHDMFRFMFLLLITRSDYVYSFDSCVDRSACSCQYGNGSIIDLGSIGKKGNFAFPYQSGGDPGSSFQYAYNPCYPVTDTNDCSNVASCQMDKNTNARYSIADAASAKFVSVQNTVTLDYNSEDQHGSKKFLTVNLICDLGVKTPKLDVTGETVTNYYVYTLTSECCCADVCHMSEPGGLSFGSIICITFSCLVIMYLVVGVTYMTVVKKERGKEMIPNYSFWSDLPGLIKEGCTFTFGKMCGGSRDASYNDI